MTASFAARDVIPGDTIRHDAGDHTVHDTHTNPNGYVTLTLTDGCRLRRFGNDLVTVTRAAHRPRRTA